MPVDRTPQLPALRNIATRLRIESVRATATAGSGHPTSCCSAAEIVTALFFAQMRFDPHDPACEDNDRFVLSKGHAAPILYAAWAEAGVISRDQLSSLRDIDSDLEGHPTPRLPFVDVATGSLGQGICAAVGTALNARRIGSSYRTYVLLGDGESAEGSVWEAAQAAARMGLDNLCAIIDVNALGQSRDTQWGHDMESYAARWRAFGWHTLVVDGHDLVAVLAALDEAAETSECPTMVLARTLKGKGISFVEGRDGWHGKPLLEDDLARALVEGQLGAETDNPSIPAAPRREEAWTPPPAPPGPSDFAAVRLPAYEAGSTVATREAYGAALAALGSSDTRVVALDADVKNSTFSDKFEKQHPDRFYQMFIAEQVMVGAALGLASRGAIPFPSTFACFLTRASDFIRMGGIGNVNIKLAGSHAGISIGEDGPSQMALEDLAMMRAVPECVVLYPCDGVSAGRLVLASAAHSGMTYMRTSRPKTPILYAETDEFVIGGSKVLCESPDDVATVVAAGVTVFEALKAHEELLGAGVHLRVIDAYCVQPIDAETMVRAGTATGSRLITVEDHYAAGGLGDAVSDAVAPDGITVTRLAVRAVPRSGKGAQLLDRFGISSKQIVAAVRAQIAPDA